MKTILLSTVTDHKYLMLVLTAAGFAYYWNSNFWPRQSPTEYPEYIKQTIDRANKFLLDKQYDQALNEYDRVLAYDPYCAVAYFNKGQVFVQQEQWDNACANYQKAIDYGVDGPHLNLIHFNYGTALFRLEKFETAIEQLNRSIAIKPHTPAYAQRALVLEKLNRLDEAHADLKIACALDQSLATAFIKIGHRYRDANDFEKAISCYRDAQKYMPNDSNVCLCLGDVFHLQGKKTKNNELIEQAITQYRHAYELNPICHLAYHNLGCMFMEQEKEREAMPYIQKALDCVPDHSATHLLLSCYYLKNGDFEQGWREYEWRNKGHNPNRHEKNPLWDGSSLAGKTILLHAEQGFGDTFHFIRYAQLVKEMGRPKKLIVEVQNALKKIASRCPYIDQVITGKDPIPTYDVQAPLMSLPHIMGTTLKTIPHHVPYIYADEQLIKTWHEKLSHNPQFKIGLCWQVNPYHDVLKYKNENVTLSVPMPSRSIPLEALEPLSKIPGVSLYSLQKELTKNSTDLMGQMNIISFDDFDTDHGAFMDTAAIMHSLDLIITADTSIAHLAGSMGIPTWVMLPHACEWRWFHTRSDSPWYPTMRLFRQKNKDSWEPTIQELCNALTSIIPS